MSTPSSLAMGRDEPNIFYINIFDKSRLGSNEGQAMDALKTNVDRSRLWLGIRAGDTVERKLQQRELPSDSSAESINKRAKYRVTVLNFLMRTGISWVGVVWNNTETKTIRANRDRFHNEIYKAFTSGMDLPGDMPPGVEDFLKKLHGILEAGGATIKDRTIRISITRYTWESITEQPSAYSHEITFRANDSLINLLGNKKNTGLTELELTIDCERVHSQFNNSSYVRDAKGSIDQYLADKEAVGVMGAPPVDVTA